MKFRISLIAILISCFSPTAFSQQAKLEGRVFDDHDRLVTGLRIVVPGGQAAVTDSKGHFTLSFPNTVRPGQATRIKVVRLNWVIFQPMFGECTTQDTANNFEPLKIIIVPRGSPLSYEPKRLSDFVDELQRRVNRELRSVNELSDTVDELQRQREKYAFLQDYAAEYGIPLDKLKGDLNEWAKDQKSDDALERARKEYWLKNYQRVTELTEEAGTGAVEVLRQKRQQQAVAARKVINIFTLQGNAFYEQYKFKEALAAFLKVERLFEEGELNKNDLLEEWGELKLFLVRAKTQLGMRGEGEEATRLLREALADVEQSTSVYSRERFPEQWAGAQNNRGVILETLSEYTAGRESQKNLNDAIAAYRTAQQVVTPERSLQRWATLEINLGNALTRLSKRLDSADNVAYLRAAIAAYRLTLSTYMRESFPSAWARAQNNLGNALLSLGELVGGAESIRYLNEAVSAHRAALEVRTLKELPEEWATTQDNLGSVIAALGLRASGRNSIQLLNDAIAAHRAALEATAREKLPKYWAERQANLGDVLYALAERTEGEDFKSTMMKAVTAYRFALDVTREQRPREWARIMTGLGNSATLVGSHLSGAKGIEQLRDAVELHRVALRVLTRDDSPSQWSTAQNNLGNALLRLGERTSGADSTRYLSDALAAYRAVIEASSHEHVPQLWAQACSNLGSASLRLGERTEGPKGIQYLNEATTAYRSALEVITREEFPQVWATTQSDLGLALTDLALRAGVAERQKYLDAAVAAYRAALEVATREQAPLVWVEVQFNLARAFLVGEVPDAAVAIYQEVLAFDPNNSDAYHGAVLVNQNVLFRFNKAFVLHQQWLAQHPNDTSAQANFAEAYFTLGRFGECEQQINVLLTRTNVPVYARTALRAIELGSLLANNKTGLVPAKFDELITEVKNQPSDFKVNWRLDGSRHFIVTNESLSPYRDWLSRLIDALASKDRDTMLQSLQALRTSFRSPR